MEIKSIEDLQKAYDGMKKELEEKGAENIKNFDEKMEALKEANEMVKGLKDAEITVDKLKQLFTDMDITLKAFDKLQGRLKAAPVNGGGQFKSFETELGEGLKAKEAMLKNYKADKKGFTLDIQAKAVGNMTSAGNLTGSYFVPPTVVPGVILKPYEEIHLRDILPVGQTSSNVVRYIRDNGGEGGPAMVAESGTKPQIDRDLQIYDANVRKIATYFRVPEEMIDDIPYLQSFLSQVGLQEVMKVEDAQILYGDGTGQNLSGLFTNATAFAAGTSVVSAPNNFDVLLAARKQGRVALYNTNVALVSPIDYYDMIEKKDTTNNYLFLGGGNGIDANNTLNVRGLRIIEHTAIAAGDFLVMDPTAAAIFDRMGTTVRFYDQDQDNAIKNLITIVIEKRLALPIYRPGALIKGTFAAAITDLTS